MFKRSLARKAGHHFFSTRPFAEETVDIIRKKLLKSGASAYESKQFAKYAEPFNHPHASVSPKTALKWAAYRYAMDHVPPKVSHQTQELAKTLYLQLVLPNSNDFVKALFSKTKLDEGTCPTVYLSPEVIREVYKNLDTYHHKTLMKIVSDGINRVGMAINKMDTDEDVFLTSPKPVDSKPLKTFVTEHLNSGGIINNVFKAVLRDEEIHSIRLLNALNRLSGDMKDLNPDDPLLTHLIRIPSSVYSEKEWSLGEDESFDYLTKAVDEPIMKSAVSLLEKETLTVDKTSATSFMKNE